jgi:hypothetical protein
MLEANLHHTVVQKTTSFYSLDVGDKYSMFGLQSKLRKAAIFPST